MGNVTTVKFKIDTVPPTVIGVTDGGNYKEKVTVRFNEGTATLNGCLLPAERKLRWTENIRLS